MYPKKALLFQPWAWYQKNARVGGHEWALKREDFNRIIQMACHYCGAEPTSRVVKLNGVKCESIEKFGGLDRADSSLGYTLANVRPCCTMCNRMKSDFNFEDFIKQIKRIIRHSG